MEDVEALAREKCGVLCLGGPGRGQLISRGKEILAVPD